MCEQAKHTPGPWGYVPSTEHHGPYVTADGFGFGDIADCYTMTDPSSLSVRNGGTSRPINHQGERADANARLIAAAPDLLAACQEFIPSFVGTNNANVPDNLVIPLDVTMGELRKLMAAIAKALGQDGESAS